MLNLKELALEVLIRELLESTYNKVGTHCLFVEYKLYLGSQKLFFCCSQNWSVERILVGPRKSRNPRTCSRLLLGYGFHGFSRSKVALCITHVKQSSALIPSYWSRERILMVNTGLGISQISVPQISSFSKSMFNSVLSKVFQLSI